MHEKSSKEKRVSWGGTRVKRYSVSDKEDIENQKKDNSRGEQNTFDFGYLKDTSEKNGIKQIGIQDYNPFLESNKQKISEINLFGVKELCDQNEDFNKNLQNDTSNEGNLNIKESKVEEESVFTTSVKSKISLFEKKIQKENLNIEDISSQKKTEEATEPLNTTTFNAFFPKENESEAMDTQKFNEIFKCNKPIEEIDNDLQNDELMNTMNIKKLLNLSPFNPYDELIKRGIRFYTKEKIQFKRLSVFQSSQESNASFFYYHKYFTKPLLNHLNEFIKYLLSLHSEIKNDHLNFSNLINPEIFNKENIDTLLRELKGMSSLIFKITWYNLRKERENKFNLVLKDNKLKLEEEYQKIKDIKQTKLDKIITRKNEKKEIEKKIEPNVKNSTLKKSSNEFSNGNEPMTASLLKRMINDNKEVNYSYRKEIDELNDKIIKNKVTLDNLNSKISLLTEDINGLNIRIKNKSVGEREYLEIKDKFKKIASISGLEIIKAYDNVFVMKVGEYFCEFLISLGNVLLIDDYSISINNKENKNLFLFFVNFLNLKNEPLRNGIMKLLEINDKVKFIIKDINSIKFNSIINYNEENDTFIIKIKKFNKKIEEKEILIKLKKDWSKEIFINNELTHLNDYGYINEAYEMI